MSYKINKTDGELLVELADGQIDTITTDITLVGKNYKGFGELFNENFVKILENFANTAPPGSPLLGQLWYDASQGRLKVYDGSSFRANGPIVSSTQPDMVAGDIWIDNDNNKMYFYDGTDLVLVGPDYNSGQGQTGFEVQSVIDIAARERVILKIWVGGSLFGVITKDEFRLSGINKLPGYPDDPNDTAYPKRQLFLKGFNFVDADFWYRGTASNARSLVDAQGNAKTAASFLPSDANGTTTGSIRIKNSAGLSVGISDTEYAVLKIVGTTTVLETQQSGTDIAMKTRVGNQFKTSLFVDSSTESVGIYTTTPQYNLDVTGTLRTTGSAVIEGDLTVQGNATYVNTSNLQVEDKNIELSVSGGAAAGDDTVADSGGLILKSTDSDKTLLWSNATNSWTSSESVDLAATKSYRINDVLVLDSTTLGNTVVNSSLTSLGTLGILRVGDIEVEANRITSINGEKIDLISSTSEVSVNNAVITFVNYPSAATDAANKQFVEDTVFQERIVFSLDITGLADPDVDVKNILQDMYPASATANDKIARIHCTSYTTVAITGIDIEGALTKSYLSVLTDDSSSASVLQDIAFTTASGITSPVPVRTVRTYRIESGAWVKYGITETYTP